MDIKKGLTIDGGKKEKKRVKMTIIAQTRPQRLETALMIRKIG